MRFLANWNLPPDAVDGLRDDGFDVSWIRRAAPGSSDEKVLAIAREEKRVVLTFDKDFGELAFHARLPPPCGMILFRIPKLSSGFIARFIRTAIGSRNDWEGHFSVVETDRIRLRSILK